ncbi:MAG: DUF4097 family beta strand repeat protein [Gemmatimonadaceae bacterium]|nr:DUF4097 family beta strand repeat protein [Gemmatimonadaceae bacterium]MCW5826530.1 DUF4097 family beta strand repeat protein [Gemmatimonadaceae bacterium]
MTKNLMRRAAQAGAMLATLALMAPTAAAQDTETVRWQGTLAAGRTIYLHNINGSVRVEAGSGNAVSLEAEKRSRRGNVDEVRIETRQTSSGDVIICALWREGSSCDEDGIRGGERRDNRRGDDVSVTMTVRVPAHAKVDARTVNGGVSVDAVQGDVRARTTNGDVEAASTAGAVYARTTNGSIRVRGVIPREGLDYHTTNGSIEIELPANANANLDLSTVNGRVTSDFPITFTGEINPRNIRATLGEGGPTLRARTTNGSIRLRKM